MDDKEYMSPQSIEDGGGKEKEEPQIVMRCELEYSLDDGEGQAFASGEASVVLYDENFEVLPQFGETQFISYRDIIRINMTDYKIFIYLVSDERLILSSIGYYYEDFARNLNKLRNEMFIKDMLMSESVVKPGIEAEYESYDDNGSNTGRGNCEVRLYDTAAIIIPEGDDPFRIPYCFFSELRVGEYEISVTLEDKRSFRLYAMGREFEPFKKSLSDAINSLAIKTQSALKGIIPSAGPLILRKVSRYILDGKAAKRSDIESLSTEMWQQMENVLNNSGMGGEYDFLKSIARREKICIGMKQGLMGELTGQYIWFIAPIYSTDPALPGNAVVMEASAGEGSGKATYIFRMTGRDRYNYGLSMEELENEADDFIRKLNFCMIAVNFRREPIYLSDEKLKEEKYRHYRTAVLKLESLKFLRNHFVGRVIHSNKEKWEQDVVNLLKFNITAQSNSEKY